MYFIEIGIRKMGKCIPSSLSENIPLTSFQIYVHTEPAYCSLQLIRCARTVRTTPIR